MRLQPRSVFLSFIILIFSLCATQAQNPLIQNGSFENGFDGWTVQGPVSVVPDFVFIPSQGSNSVQILSGGNLAQTISVSSSTTYLLTFDFRAAGAGGASVLNVNVSAPGGALLGQTIVARDSGYREFRHDSLVFSVPSDVTEAIISFSNVTSAAAYPDLDNVALSLTNAAASATAVNGGFEGGLTGWNYNDGVYIICNSVFPAAEGNNSVALGSANISGSVLSQQISVVPRRNYVLAFKLGALSDFAIASVTASVTAGEQTLFTTNVTAGGFDPFNDGYSYGGYHVVQAPFAVPVDIDRVTISFADVSEFGGIGVDPLIDAVSLRDVLVPIISIQPSDNAPVNGAECSFSVQATGEGALSFQWLFNGTNIVDATNLTYTTAGSVDTVGGYSVIVSNAYGAVTSQVAQLSLLLPPTAVVVSPATNFAFTTGPATFTASVSGDNRVSYSWFFNGSLLSWATNSSLRLYYVQPSSSGLYNVVVSNAAGAVTSSPAVLSVLDWVSGGIVADAVAHENSSFILPVSARGSDLHFHWWLPNGELISTNDTLMLPHITQSGYYTVSVTNAVSGFALDTFVRVFRTSFDLNEDGNPDLLLRSPNGTFAALIMNGSVPGRTILLSGGQEFANWRFVGTKDFDGDGHRDIVLQDGNGTTVFLPLNHFKLGKPHPVLLPAGLNRLRLVGVGHFIDESFGGFGYDEEDLVALDKYNQVSIWRTSGTNIINGGLPVIGAPHMGTDWKVLGVIDNSSDQAVINDGFVASIIWENDNGSVMRWNLVNDSTTRGSVKFYNSEMIPAFAHGWKLSGWGNFTTDCYVDYVWQSPDGSIAIIGNSARLGRGAVLSEGAVRVPRNWQLVAPH